MYKRVEIIIAACFYYSGLVKLARWWRRRSRSSLVILCYHQATGRDLRQHMLYLRRHYRVLHLEAALKELYTTSKNGQKRRDRRSLLAMTFDDGYRDNYTHGATLACELQVPITIFLIPGYIESGSRFWWDEGEHLVRHSRVIEAEIERRTYHLNKLDERKALTKAIDTRVREATSVIEREEFLAAVHKVLAVPLAITAEEMARLPLTWTEVEEIEKSGWVSFGAHTMHHPILSCLTNPTEVQYEVSECRKSLERQLGHSVRTFAYPFGQLEHIGETGLCAVREAGYDWALTTLSGLNTPQTDPHLLRRVVVDDDQHWLSVASKASGVWTIFSSLFRIPIPFIVKCFRSISKK